MLDNFSNTKTKLTDEQKRLQKISLLQEKHKKFMEALVDLVEGAVVSGRKRVRVPITNRKDIPRLRHLIRRVARGLGYQINNVKKRHIFIEHVKFEIFVLPKIIPS